MECTLQKFRLASTILRPRSILRFSFQTKTLGLRLFRSSLQSTKTKGKRNSFAFMFAATVVDLGLLRSSLQSTTTTENLYIFAFMFSSTVQALIGVCIMELPDRHSRIPPGSGVVGPSRWGACRLADRPGPWGAFAPQTSGRVFRCAK